MQMMRHSYLYFIGEKKVGLHSFSGKHDLFLRERVFLGYLFVSPLERMEFCGVPGTLLDTAYGLYMCLKIIQCVVTCGGNVFISGACSQEALSCLSGCEMYFLYAVLRSS